MKRHVQMRGCLAGLLLAWSLVGGCHKPAVTEKPVPDPLLTSKKAIEGRPHSMDEPARSEDLLAPPPPPGYLAPQANDAPVAHLLGVRAAQK
jgi:hypothetical protein